MYHKTCPKLNTGMEPAAGVSLGNFQWCPGKDSVSTASMSHSAQGSGFQASVCSDQPGSPAPYVVSKCPCNLDSQQDHRKLILQRNQRLSPREVEAGQTKGDVHFIPLNLGSKGRTTHLFLLHFYINFFIIVFWLWNIWDLSCPTRNWTHAHCNGSSVS